MVKNKEAKRTREFSIPIDLMYDFSKVVVDNGLVNWIDGINEDEEEIIMLIRFEDRQWKVIEKLYEMIDEYDEYDEDDDEEYDD